MNSINYSKKLIFTFLFIFLSSFILYSFICFIYGFLLKNVLNDISELSINKNLIRATYPNYKEFNPNYAKKIFEEFASSKSRYNSYTGYRRKAFSGKTLNINEAGFRKSINHSTDNSIWFLGGSTMWGTGSDDERTIPSYFAKLSNEKVWNLGESGYNSFQETIQLQILLAKKYRPKKVIFYDGVNDGYYFCQKDDLEQLRHAYSSRYLNIIENYKKVRKELNQKNILSLEKIISKSKNFYSRPLRYFNAQKRYNIIKENVSKNRALNQLVSTENYLACDEDEILNNAVNITLNSWNYAYTILNKMGIEVYFILQPTATYFPEKYNLDYIINEKKISILNEKKSYQIYYKKLKERFKEECKKKNNCSTFIDLSELFFDNKKEIFIDTCHVSPNGNLLIAQEMIKRIYSKK